jgi:hypothetical protein
MDAAAVLLDSTRQTSLLPLCFEKKKILLSVGRYLTLPDLFHASQACRKWRRLFADPDLRLVVNGCVFIIAYSDSREMTQPFLFCGNTRVESYYSTLEFYHHKTVTRWRHEELTPIDRILAVWQNRLYYSCVGPNVSKMLIFDPKTGQLLSTYLEYTPTFWDLIARNMNHVFESGEYLIAKCEKWVKIWYRNHANPIVQLPFPEYYRLHDAVISGDRLTLSAMQNDKLLKIYECNWKTDHSLTLVYEYGTHNRRRSKTCFVKTTGQFICIHNGKQWEFVFKRRYFKLPPEFKDVRGVAAVPNRLFIANFDGQMAEINTETGEANFFSLHIDKIVHLEVVMDHFLLAITQEGSVVFTSLKKDFLHVFQLNLNFQRLLREDSNALNPYVRVDGAKVSFWQKNGGADCCILMDLRRLFN